MTYNGLSIKNTLYQDNLYDLVVLQEKVKQNLEENDIVILPPMDVMDSINLVKMLGIHATCTILDPWYNKGIGGTLPCSEYDEFINRILVASGEISNHIFLWGFPEIIGPYVRFAPNGFTMTAWLTWYYKNCPSVIRGWRSSQNACIHFSKKNKAKMHPENFLNEIQIEKYNAGKLRFIPGPSSVIEEPLIIGFVGKKERTNHPAQKPEKVFERIILMATTNDEIVFDPMAGSGTTSAVAKKL
jgi:site-specific DNA-methyltransferase (adenine-specific)